jgi:hypothetical protein
MIWKVLEWSGRGLIEVPPSSFLEEKSRNPSVMIVCVLAEIRTRKLPNTSQKLYRFSHLARSLHKKTPYLQNLVRLYTSIYFLFSTPSRPASYPTGTGGKAVKMTPHVQPVPRSRKRGSIPPLPPYVFIAQCFISYAQGQLYHTVHWPSIYILNRNDSLLVNERKTLRNKCCKYSCSNPYIYKYTFLSSHDCGPRNCVLWRWRRWCRRKPLLNRNLFRFRRKCSMSHVALNEMEMMTEAEGCSLDETSSNLSAYCSVAPQFFRQV